jgi:hypothetical protein
MPSLTGYAKYTQFLMKPSTDGALSNYPVRLEVHKGSGTSTLTDLYLENNCANWPYDIRFTNSTGTLLTFAREVYNSTDQTIWLKIDSINADYTGYIFTGNPTASDASDWANTFLDGQDFTGVTTLDASKWTVTPYSVNPEYYFGTNDIILMARNGGGNKTYLSSLYTHAKPVAIRCIGVGFTNAHTTVGVGAFSHENNFNGCMQSEYQMTTQLQCNDTSAWDTYVVSHGLAGHIIDIVILDNKCLCYDNNVLATTLTNHQPTGDLRLFGFAITGDSSQSLCPIPRILMRPVTEHEPYFNTFSAWSSGGGGGGGSGNGGHHIHQLHHLLGDWKIV